MNRRRNTFGAEGLGTTNTLTAEDQTIIDRVESYLADGLSLKKWWNLRARDDKFDARFELTRAFNQAEISYGFFDEVPLAHGPMPIMGNVQEMLFDRPRTPRSESPRVTARWMQDQIREFALRYFLRISSFRQPEAFAESNRTQPPEYLRRLSWCTTESIDREGFGFTQLYYKSMDGRIGKFAESEQKAIVDLRTLGDRYQWIVLKVNIFNFSFKANLAGDNGPQLVIPLKEASHLVVTRDFICDEINPERGLLGQYGFGYAFIKDPVTHELAYGPGQFDAALELIRFRVMDDGETRVRMIFISNRPKGVLNLSVNPLDWGFGVANLMTLGASSYFLDPMKEVLDRVAGQDPTIDPVIAYISLANAFTGGQAARDFCISRDQLDRRLLLQHFMQHYQTMTGALLTWRQIPDWLDTGALPEWVITGVSS